ncbi:MFS transporter [Panacibacter ginsenosidivorans]|uniref:MFS transporter n=1 Tax=Panacibacter ginsenosidivorans TaxID=1813871 RepID=A0A5B8VBH7_9BACT|nr:MFS transporter [Panacibacter ginsenosidivorans]QEC68375.1 MFS transporter [Panacibacter ginsenosidivorans]
MHNWKIKVSLFLNYFVFAILLNSSGIAILQVQNSFGVSKGSAAWIDPCKDFSIAIMSFLVSSYITKIGYRRAMLIALGAIAGICFIIPNVPSFFAVKLLFIAVGACFALIKMSVYSTIGIITKDSKEHISFMNFIESFFMIGNLTLYFVFSSFVDNNNPQSTNWLNAYYVLGILSLLAFLLLLSSVLDESAIKSEAEKPITEQLSDMLKLFLKPVVLAFLASAFLYVLIEQSIQNFLPTFNNKVLLLPATLSIQMGSILAGSTALGRFLAGIVLKKLNWFYVLVACLLLAATLVLIAMPLAKEETGTAATGWLSAPIAAYIFPLIGLLLAPIYPAINSVILTSLPKTHHGFMSGLIIIFSAIGGTVGSLLTGNIFDVYGGQAAFYFSLVPMALLIMCLFFFNKLKKGNDVAEFNTMAGH